MNDERPLTIGNAPQFCPDCGRAAVASEEFPLCGQCGGILAVQGYCPICESCVRRRVGEPCPKHDVALLADGPDRYARPWKSSTCSWVTVKRFPDSLAATSARIRLDAEGIPTFVEGERMGAPAMYRVATGGVKLQVPAEFVADARIVLSQAWSWPDDEWEEEDDPAPQDDALAPPETDSGRAFLIELALVGAFAIPLLAALVAYYCGN